MSSSITGSLLLDSKLDTPKELWEIYTEVTKRNKESYIGNPDQVPEISLLLRCASSSEDSFELCSTSNTILVQLCKQKYMKEEYLLNKLLTFSATSRYISCIVKSIRDVLMFQVSEQLEESGFYKCPYQIRATPHPWVTLLQQRRDSFYVILDEIKHWYLSSTAKPSKESRCILAVIKPFLSFVLLDPNSARSWEGHALHSTLVQLLNLVYDARGHVTAFDIAGFLLTSYLCRKTDATSISESVLMVAQLAECLIKFPDGDALSALLTRTSYQILVNCHHLLNANLSISTSLNLLKVLFQKQPKILLQEESIFLLALLLYQSPAVYREDILKLVILVLPCFMAQTSNTSSINIARAFYLPLLRILFGGSDEDQSHKRCQLLARNIFVNIHREIKAFSYGVEESHQDEEIAGMLPCEVIIARHHCALLLRIDSDKLAAKEFLMMLADTQNPCPSLLLLLSTLVTSPSNVVMMEEILEVIAVVIKGKPSLALDFLLLLLDVTNHCNDPLVNFQALNFLPVIGAQKLLVAPVLKTITLLASSTSLLPTCIRIATELWKKQPRVFPHLLKLVSKKIDNRNISVGLREEIIIARASTVLDICKLRPAQHGADVVGLLANIFDEFDESSNELAVDANTAETAVLLGLEALKALCESEVVDFSTAWAVISTKLRNNTSETVTRGIIALFSISPNVLGRSPSEMALKDEALSFLWGHADNKNPRIAGAAFAALANFTLDEFRVKHLPDDVRLLASEILQKKHNLKKRPDDESFCPDIEAIPGPAYISLLQNLEDDATDGFSVLLTKLLKEEVASLPRNLSTATTAKRLGAAYERFLDSIPEFLRSIHEKSKRPALIPGLSYGLLCCYKSSVLSGKSEKLGRRHHIENAKVHRQMLDNCLNEITIPQMELHHCLVAPTAWINMMSKLFDIVVEGRKAELSLLYERGKLDSEEHLKNEQANALFWTRDQLTNQLMRASKGLPSVQGNSILALSGLAYKISLIDSDGIKRHSEGAPVDSVQFVNNKEWLLRVADTMSSHKSTASSLLARASAAIALSVVAVTLISVDVDRIEQIMAALIARIPGREQAGNSPVMHFNCAVGLGLLVSRLEQEQLLTIFGDDRNSLIKKATETLEKAYYNDELEHRDGVTIGLGLAASFGSNTKDGKSEAIASHVRLLANVSRIRTDGNQSSSFEKDFFSLAVSTVKGFVNSRLDAPALNGVIDVLLNVSKDNPKSWTLSSSLGMLLHGALSSGLARARDILESAIDLWLGTLTNEASMSEEKIAAVYGIVSAFGSYRFLLQLDDADVFDPSLKNKFAVVIKTIQQIMQASEDTTLCLHCSKLLGLIFMVNDGVISRNTSLPSNYAYLPESSVLRCSFCYLLQAGKSGPCISCSSAKVSSVLKGLITASVATLPPVNWALAFTPLMKLGFCEETKRLCLKFVVENSCSSPALPTWLLSWLNPPSFLSLGLVCQKELLKNLDVISKIVPVNRLKMVLEDMIMSLIQTKEDDRELREAVFAGLKKIATMKNPPQSSLLYVRNSLENISVLCNPLENEETLRGVAGCFILIPKELQESFNASLEGNRELLISLNCVLVAYHGAPLKLLQNKLEPLSEDSDRLDSRRLQRMRFALQRHSPRNSSCKSQEEEVLWLLDQMGNCRQLIGKKSVESLCYLLQLVATCVASWSSSGTVPTMVNQSEVFDYSAACWVTFPSNIVTLVQLPRWRHLEGKVVEWLVFLLEAARSFASEDGLTRWLHYSLIALRNSEVWKSQAIWTKALDLVVLEK